MRIGGARYEFRSGGELLGFPQQRGDTLRLPVRPSWPLEDLSVWAGGRRIELVGVDDPHVERDDYASVAGRADSTADLAIGLTHSPEQRVLDEMAVDGCRLLLAGHTHGGQVCVPGFGALVTNCGLDRRMAKGLHRWPGTASYLHVSAGLGTHPTAPVRFACPPEASLLTLVPA